jgi:hypothetical protein
MTGYDGHSFHYYPDKSFEIILILLKEIEPFTTLQAQEHLEVPTIKAVKNLIEELIRRKMIVNICGRGTPISLYRLTRIASMYLPKDINKAFIPTKDRPKCIFELKSLKVNKLMGRLLTSQETQF